MLSDDGPVIGQVAQSTFVAGRTQLVVRCLNHDLPVEISGRGPAIGSTVRITFSHDALHPLKAGA